MLGLPRTRALVDVHQTAGLNGRNIIYRNMCGNPPIVSVTYENERISIKNSLPYKMCVMSLLCGPWADLWPFDGLYCKWYSKRFTVPEKEKRLGVKKKATAGNSFRVMKSWGITYLTDWAKNWLRAGCNLSCNGEFAWSGALPT